MRKINVRPISAPIVAKSKQAGRNGEKQRRRLAAAEGYLKMKRMATNPPMMSARKMSSAAVRYFSSSTRA